MNVTKHLAAFGFACALALGIGSSALAVDNTSQATLQNGTGTSVCALTVNSGAAINFGTYVYNGDDYLRSGSRASAVNFVIGVATNTYPTDCSVNVSGTNLVNSTYSIPVGRISLAQNAGTVSVNTIAALTTTPQTLVSAVGGTPLGNGNANVTATLTLTGADDNNIPGAYSGTITFTGVPAVTP